jgi:hypothetical protein
VEAYEDVDLTAASFDGTSKVTYNALGMPAGAGGTLLVSGKVEISVGNVRLAVVIDPVTGHASVQTTDSVPKSGLISWLLGGLGF